MTKTCDPKIAAKLDAIWDRLKTDHDAKHGEGDADMLAQRGMVMLNTPTSSPDTPTLKAKP